MFVQSNDKFYAPDPKGVDLFDGEKPIAADLTKRIMLWDAGTELDEPPGIGSHQAPRQSTVDSGPAEGGTVHLANDGFSYPPTSEVIQFTGSAADDHDLTIVIYRSRRDRNHIVTETLVSNPRYAHY